MGTPANPGVTSSHQVKRSCGCQLDHRITATTVARSARCDRGMFFMSSGSLLSPKFHGEMNRGYHAFGARDIFPSDCEGGPVIGARAGKGKAEGNIHAFVKRMELQRDQPL